jgi:hypothetical protein
MRGNPDGSLRRVFDPPYEGKPIWFSLIGGRCARLLSFRYIDGLYLTIGFSTRRLGVGENKVMAGRNAAMTAALVY